MKFKVGDKVRVKEDLKVGYKYGWRHFDESMKKYKNKVATITRIIDRYICCYDLDIDNFGWGWTDEMLEPVEVIEYKNKKYDVYKEIDCDNDKFNKVLQLKEVKKEILDDIEKEYLENVIRPFKDEIKSIKKKKFKSKECIRFETNRDDEEYFELLSFPNNSMYKGMKLDEPYTLENLDL